MIAVIIGQYVLIGGLLYICFRFVSKYERLVDNLMRFVKPDTAMQLKGMNEAIKDMKQFITEERRKRTDKEMRQLEIQHLNRIGAE